VETLQGIFWIPPIGVNAIIRVAKHSKKRRVKIMGNNFEVSGKTNRKKSVLRILKIVLIGLLAVIVLAVAGFLIWAEGYSRADGTAKAILSEQNIKQDGRETILSPASPSDTALIFYPGGKVEAIAYLPMLEKITRESGITCILVKMPLNLAVFDPKAADGVMKAHPEIKNWYIGGHSLGGPWPAITPQRIRAGSKGSSSWAPTFMEIIRPARP